MEHTFFEESSKEISSPSTIEQPNTELSVVVEKKDKPTTVSFSQYAMWMKCPFRWKLSYIDYLAKYEDSINTLFGDAIHEPLQAYLTLLYTEGAVAADALDVHAMFNKIMEDGKSKLKMASEEQISTLTDEEIDELGAISPSKFEDFKRDGRTILNHVLSPSIRKKHFPSGAYDVVGVELPVIIPMRRGRIVYKGYLDIVLRDKKNGKILILDFKTSTMGWNKWQKQDRTKLDQLVLYKRFYNQLFNVPLSDIKVEFFVMKRKLMDNVNFPQQRIQRFSPPDGSVSIKTVEKTFAEFINDCFTPEGLPDKDKAFIKYPDKGKKNCKYCPFKTMINPATNEKYCDGKEG